jgi:2-iminobutanoate/2-iminopropanoate deaminase
MPKREIKHPQAGKSTGAYSPAVEIDGWVYVSGQGPLDPKTAEVIRGPIGRETEVTLQRIDAILGQAGCTRADVVKTTVHLSDIRDFEGFNAAYATFFKDVAVLPARTTVQSVLWNGIKVEIDAVARKPAPGPKLSS